jgi:antitoxin (DNA-binding transcriptional repressor) of toxin-antitoxin stability system
MNMRQLRDTRRLKALLKAGKTVELRERDRVIGCIVPQNAPGPARELPDFAVRLSSIFGERIVPGADLAIEERGRF